MATASNAELAAARLGAAEQLEVAIHALGRALAAYNRATTALELRANVELERYVQNAIILHLANAGLGGFLETRLTGAPPPLRLLVEQQHRRSIVFGPQAE